MPELFLVGMNHQVASLPLRERMAISPEALPSVLENLLMRLKDIDKECNQEAEAEAAILSTCNRCEVYGYCSDAHHGQDAVQDFLVGYTHIDREELSGAMYTYTGNQAVAHLFRVAAGLDSLLVGENEILGQVRAAAEVAQSASASGPVLKGLFRHAVTAGKRVRAETDLGMTGLSIGSLVVEMAQQLLGPLHERTALLIGAGKISSIVAHALVRAGLRCILVTNRTFERALRLASDLGEEHAAAVRFDALDQILGETDILISSTGAPHLVLHAESVKLAMHDRLRPMLIADLAVPRDVDPEAGNIAGVHLVNIDDLEGLVQTYLPQIAFARREAEKIIEEEQARFGKWYLARRNVPLICAIRKKADAICDEEIVATLFRLGEIPMEQQALVRALGKAIANRILHDPLSYLRELPDGELTESELQRIIRIFNMGDIQDQEEQDHQD